MKKFMAIALVLAMVLAVGIFAACDFDASDVEGIRFIKAPNASYELNENVNVAQFEVEVTYNDDSIIKFSLNNSALTVQGLTADNKLDTSTVGTHTIIVSYQAVTCQFTYTVTGEEQKQYITEAPTNSAEYEFYNTLKNKENYTLTADLDLSKYEWVPIDLTGTKEAIINITIDGDNNKITGLNISNESLENNNAAGLFGVLKYVNLTVKDITFENTTIISAGKQVAVIVGNAFNGGILTVENVTFKNTVLAGLSCVAPVVGRTNGYQCIVKNVEVDGANLSAYNNVTVSTADGEGDKVGAIAGQLQANTTGHTIQNCTVKNTSISGTRCLGGLVGYVSQTATFVNNTIEESVVVAASVPGGMLKSKGTRNVGGLIGTIENAPEPKGENTEYILKTVTLNNNEVKTSFLFTNEDYEESSKGKYIGGLRGTTENASRFKIVLIEGEVTKTITYTDEAFESYTVADFINNKNFDLFVEYQKVAMDLINA